MAEFNDIHVNDRLRIEVPVLMKADPTDGSICIYDRRASKVSDQDQMFIYHAGHTRRVWITPTAVRQAEHIPAPKVFKRGDFVRSLLSSADRGGLVVGQRDIKSEVWVTWPGNEQCQPVPLPSETLEHDEAPE